MAPDERGWHRLYDRATEVLGQEEADELMARVPVTAWTEIATKRDLELGLENVENRVTAAFHRELTAQAKTFIAWTGVLMAVFTAVNAIANTTIAIAVR